MQGKVNPPLGAPSLANGAPGSASRRGAPEAGPGTESARRNGPWSVFGALFERDHGPFRRALPGGAPRTSGPLFRLFTTAPLEQNP